jgi:hypothetical protein
MFWFDVVGCGDVQSGGGCQLPMSEAMVRLREVSCEPPI